MEKSQHTNAHNTNSNPPDLTPAELAARLGHLAPWPLLLLQSGADECVPDQSTIAALGERIMAAVSGGSGGGGSNGGVLRRHAVMAGAPHNAAGHAPELARHVGDFLNAINSQ